jgi:hypothetical protein
MCSSEEMIAETWSAKTAGYRSSQRRLREREGGDPALLEEPK